MIMEENKKGLYKIINSELTRVCMNLCYSGKKDKISYYYPTVFTQCIAVFANKIYKSMLLNLETMITLPIEELEILTKQYMRYEQKEKENGNST